MERSEQKRWTTRHLTRVMALPTVDASVMESQHAVPLYVLACVYFDKRVDVQKVQEIIRERLFTIPRFRSRLAVDAKGSCFFEPIPLADIDISQMVSEVHDVKTTQDLDSFASDVYERPMDLTLPLWRCYIMNDMADGRSLLCWVVNHCLADGPALFQVLLSLLDEKPDMKLPRARPTPRVGCFTGLMACLAACFNVTIGDQLPGDPPSRLKERNHRQPDKRKALAQCPGLSLEQLKEVTSKFPGATINDVLMTVVCLTIQSYFKKHEPEVIEKKQRFRGNFPINLRHGDMDVTAEENFGNRFAPGNLTFPLHLEDPCQILWHLKAQIDRIKQSPEPMMRDALTRMLVQSRLGRARVFNLVLDLYGKVSLMLSNVPGPQVPVSLAGQPITDIAFYAFAPLGLYLGIVSYNGKVSCGVAVSQSCEPDASLISGLWLHSFEKLYTASMAHRGSVPRTV